MTQRFMRLWTACLLQAVVLCTGTLAQAGEVTVAVAANFNAPMQRIARAFTQETGHQARLAFGATGKFYAQIQHGAPFEVLLAADAETPARLEKEGLAVAGTRFTYARGRLALWSRDARLVDPDGEVLRSLRGIAAHDKLAVADPRVAPYGAAAVQTLAQLGVSALWTHRLVQGESIAQAHQFVHTGNARLGFVALSQIWHEGRVTDGSAWVVPAHWHAPLQQDAVLLTTGQRNPAAQALLQYLRSDAARALVRAHGYER